jgi:hypothetical protein
MLSVQVKCTCLYMLSDMLCFYMCTSDLLDNLCCVINCFEVAGVSLLKCGDYVVCCG